MILFLPKFDHLMLLQVLILYYFAFQMCLVFNEEGLRDVEPPCVAQTFINHNGRLYKIFTIGEYCSVVQRPSIKNLSAGPTKTIFFDSHDVSKAGSCSFLNQVHILHVQLYFINLIHKKIKICIVVFLFWQN